ncbi:MAG: ribosome small subunit-dependent GTPase A [Bacilli bacterium]|nr:ribosome small subunit-dependent GTPase A [Bacilli bacterium]
MRKGFILSCNAGNYKVDSTGEIFICRARGKFRIDKEKPLAGDEVIFDEKENYLLKIGPRKNSFVRPPIANVDQVIVIASITNPPISLALINRFITMSIVCGLKPIIALSKVDLINKDDELLQKINNAYKDLDYKIIPFSNKTRVGIEEIVKTLDGKKTVFTGQSGVGKSSLINNLLPEYNKETGDISKALGRGKHITRLVEFLKYENGWIVDTPGFSLIDIDLKPFELATCYPGFENLFSKCKFRNCLHESEKGCAVKGAMESGIISKDHYDIYLSLLEELKNKKERF